MMRDRKGNSERIWYVEDDVDLLNGTIDLLREHGFKTHGFSNAADASSMLSRTRPDLLMLDWNLPDSDGISLCRKTREAFTELPMLMVTVRDDPHDVIEGLESGADDYVTKPFDAGVLVSRIRALLRRTSASHTVFSCGDVDVDIDAAQAFRSGSAIDLTPTEYRLLELFMQNKGRILTRNQIIQKIWSTEEDSVYDNTLTVAIKRLRSKLGRSDYIKTVRNFGYRMEEPS